jgi:hypothetical protein
MAYAGLYNFWGDGWQVRTWGCGMGLRKGESLEALVIRLAQCNVDLTWAFYSRNLGSSVEEKYVVMVGYNRHGVAYEVGDRYEVESKFEGMRLVSLGSGERKSAVAGKGSVK